MNEGGYISSDGDGPWPILTLHVDEEVICAGMARAARAVDALRRLNGDES